MDTLLVVGAVSIATPVVASLIIAATAALERHAPVPVERGRERPEA